MSIIMAELNTFGGGRNIVGALRDTSSLTYTSCTWREGERERGGGGEREKGERERGEEGGRGR